eukprot:TRINITY_DN26820_c0_g1_i1.p1 TRINITY_DN26820_c0_g1~~TRINITY_DN26820_c0_g1_i1.p1  ORF type:complete len:650 (+),score=59.99 TRINITY_DN26820_c0_g1_i1:155-2104(+)
MRHGRSRGIGSVRIATDCYGLRTMAALNFNVGGWRLTPYSFGFVMCLVVVFIDMMGNQFLQPVLTPYSLSLGLSKTEISTLFSATAAGQVLSSFMLPLLSDKRGRKVAILVSVSGSVAGYLIQGLSFLPAYPRSYAMLLTGKAVAGLFAGTAPVTTAYISELSMPDTNLLKVRMTTMMTVQQQAGNFLGPIAGSLATFGLHIPFLVSSGTGLLCLPVLLRYFLNVDDIRRRYGAQAPVAETANAGRPIAPATPKPKGLDSPFCRDIVMNCYLICYVLIGMLMIGIGPLLAFLLLNPSFGLRNPADLEKEQERVAQVVSLCILPMSICQGIATTFVFVPLSNRVGEGKCGFFSGIVAALCMVAIAMLAFFSDVDLYDGEFQPRIWMLIIALSIYGSQIGILVPLTMASAPKYRAIMYPHRLASAGAYCQRGIFLGMFAGGPVLLGLYQRTNLMSTFLLVASIVFGFYVVFAIADSCAAKKIAAKAQADKERVEMDLCTPVRRAFSRNAMAKEDFRKKMHGMIDDLLQKGNYSLWSRSDQALVEAELELAFQQLPVWQDSDDGYSHNVEVLKRLHALGDARSAQELLSNAPALGQDALLLHHDDSIDGTGAGVVTFNVDCETCSVTSPARTSATAANMCTRGRCKQSTVSV